MSCDTRDVIYVITCPGCNEYHIGETSNTLRSRARVHKQQINTPAYRQIQLSAHIETCGNKQFTIFSFYKLET
jgi:Tfp pilus assembly protein PilV